MITILTGPNSYEIIRQTRRITADFVAEHGDLALERLDGEEVSYDRMREALESMPFLAAKKLVILRVPSANKDFIENAEKLLAALGDDTDVIIIEPKLDKRTAYYKSLKAKPGFRECAELDENGLARWLCDEARLAQGSLSMADARFMVSRVGANQQLLANELQKLLAYDASISHRSIELLVDPLPQSTVFDLLDAAFGGRHAKTLEIYAQQRLAKVEPQQIIAMIAWQLHILAIIKTAGDRDVQTIAREAKLNPYVVRKSSQLAAVIPYIELKELVRRALDLDVSLKTRAIDADDAVQHFLLTIARRY